jgi:hypothetical protein
MNNDMLLSEIYNIIRSFATDQNKKEIEKLQMLIASLNLSEADKVKLEGQVKDLTMELRKSEGKEKEATELIEELKVNGLNF